MTIDSDKPVYIRLAQIEDIARVIEVEIEAGEVFKSLGFPDPPQEGFHLSEEVLRAGITEKCLWVATINNLIVGFVLAGSVDDNAHLLEIDVIPAYSRQGIGRGLIAQVIDWARTQEYKYLTLTTFRDVPWNGLFYARIGFEELDVQQMGKQLAQILLEEKENNLVAWERCAMQLSL